MKTNIFLSFILFIFLSSSLCIAQNESHVRIITSYGSIILKLYDQTPQHRDNFLKLVKDGYYNNQLFHRVIQNFMIQGGDPNSTNSSKGEMLGMGGPPYTISAEFNKNLYHKKGAIAAARKGDAVNPEKESSGNNVSENFPGRGFGFRRGQGGRGMRRRNRFGGGF